MADTTTITIMGLPFKRRRSNKPNVDVANHHTNAMVTMRHANALLDRQTPFFRRRTSLPSAEIMHSNSSAAVISPEHGGGMRRCTTGSLHSQDSSSRTLLDDDEEQDNMLVLDDDDGEHLFLPSPNKPTFLSRSVVIQDEPLSLEHAVRAWLSRTDALIKSKEMSNFLSSSRDLAFVAGGVAIRTACYPVTVPLHLATTATSLVVGTCGQVLCTTGTILQQVAKGAPPGGQDTSSFGLLHHVLQMIPLTIQTASRITDGLGTTVLQLVAPVLGHQDDAVADEGEALQRHGYTTSSGESSAEHESFLDRLRLDYVPPAHHHPHHHQQQQQQQHPTNSHTVESESKLTIVAAKSEVSKYLLYVADLGMMKDDAPVTRVIMYIDLDKNFADEVLTAHSLEELVSRGLALVSNVEEVRLHKHVSGLPLDCVQWKAENSTERLLKGMHDDDWTTKLQANTLIWSGRMQGRWGRGHDFPFFLARGIVKGGPRQFLDLLWDNSRTNEYNKHSLGRSDLLVIQDGVLDGASTGTKVVKSETRVPFTGISVVLATLMHVRPLHTPEEGFVIVSRSLNSGRAGCHSSAEFVEKGTNEILWGVNILRRVPGKPHVTDLTSISQVATTLVPKFLAHRIGIMGVEDFFSAVR